MLRETYFDFVKTNISSPFYCMYVRTVMIRVVVE